MLTCHGKTSARLSIARDIVIENWIQHLKLISHGHCRQRIIAILEILPGQVSCPKASMSGNCMCKQTATSHQSQESRRRIIGTHVSSSPRMTDYVGPPFQVEYLPPESRDVVEWIYYRSWKTASNTVCVMDVETFKLSAKIKTSGPSNDGSIIKSLDARKPSFVTS